jgi:hypothetical protein
MLLLLSLLACQDDICPDGQPDPVALDGVLETADSCGAWTLAVDDHVYINVGITEAESECTAELPASFELPYDPIYSNFEPSGPKWTYDFLAVGAGDEQLTVSCADGTVWTGWFSVQ